MRERKERECAGHQVGQFGGGVWLRSCTWYAIMRRKENSSEDDVNKEVAPASESSGREIGDGGSVCDGFNSGVYDDI